MNRKERRATGRSAAGNPLGAGLASATLAQMFQAAVTQHQNDALGEAERRYRYILTLHPNHADSLHNLGLILLNSGNAAAAEIDPSDEYFQKITTISHSATAAATACQQIGKNTPRPVATPLPP